MAPEAGGRRKTAADSHKSIILAQAQQAGGRECEGLKCWGVRAGDGQVCTGLCSQQGELWAGAGSEVPEPAFCLQDVVSLSVVTPLGQWCHSPYLHRPQTWPLPLSPPFSAGGWYHEPT